VAASSRAPHACDLRLLDHPWSITLIAAISATMPVSYSSGLHTRDAPHIKVQTVLTNGFPNSKTSSDGSSSVASMHLHVHYADLHSIHA
jgi:hypothetical protein